MTKKYIDRSNIFADVFNQIAYGREEGSEKMEQVMLKELVAGILSVLGDRAERIVLYGSVARKTELPESDIDIAVIMYGTLDGSTEERLSDVIVDLNLKYDRVFSVVDIDADQFVKWEKVMPFYQNVNREGIVLWTAA